MVGRVVVPGLKEHHSLPSFPKMKHCRTPAVNPLTHVNVPQYVMIMFMGETVVTGITLVPSKQFKK